MSQEFKALNMCFLCYPAFFKKANNEKGFLTVLTTYIYKAWRPEGSSHIAPHYDRFKEAGVRERGREGGKWGSELCR